MRSGFTHYAERYVGRSTVTLCSEKLVTAHNVWLLIREDLGPSLHASPAELLTHSNGEKGDYSCQTLAMERGLLAILAELF